VTVSGTFFGRRRSFPDFRAKKCPECRGIYSKTVKWEPESEYRLVIHLGQDEPEWDTLRYHPEEVTELYLGSAMNQQDRADILATAKALNPNIKVFQAKRNAKGVIAFDVV